MFDFTVRLGDVITMLSVFGGAAFAFASIKGTLSLHSLRLSNIEKIITDTSGLITAFAVQNNRLNNVEGDIRELRHGRGFVKDGINGEWNNEGKIK